MGGNDESLISETLIQEVAELARCEHKAVRRAIRDGALRAFRPTKRLLIRQDDATAWIESRMVAGWREPGVRLPSPRVGAKSDARAGSVASLREIERQAIGA